MSTTAAIIATARAIGRAWAEQAPAGEPRAAWGGLTADDMAALREAAGRDLTAAEQREAEDAAREAYEG